MKNLLLTVIFVCLVIIGAGGLYIKDMHNHIIYLHSKYESGTRIRIGNFIDIKTESYAFQKGFLDGYNGKSYDNFFKYDEDYRRGYIKGSNERD